ncbi:MAG TPA: hypothetical protein PK490_15945 [Prosthecobacter sp.]|nr:hypothetical protein [Prosthecobacter sp.]HRK15775.1 hypothetical protein [Prosthecobacter sp.]
MQAFAATLLLARAHLRMMRQRTRHALRTNRLLLLTIGGFLGLYCAAAYVLVARGLDFIAKMPLFGPLLTERMVHLLFFFFFVMLVISNATITGMGLFRRKEMDWQVALPVPWTSLVMWKTLEGMALASWGLLVLSAPILAALGRVYHAGPFFYLASVPALLCLVSLSASISTWLLLILVRHARRWWWRPAAVLGAALLVLALKNWFSQGGPEDLAGGDLVATMQEVMKHTEICTHPLLPSSWVAEVVFAAGREAEGRAGFFILVLLANALFALLVTARLGAVMFYPAWHRVMAAVPLARATDKADPWYRLPAKKNSGFWRRLWGLDRASYAVVLKDVRTFLREPAQWGQSLLIFGLLLMYTSNLRKLGYDLQSPFWVIVISHLNLLVCCLALSTLTTRFVFPQISMEGQRLWILGLSPVSLARVLGLKLRLSAGVMALLTMMLVIVSSLSLALPWERALFFCIAVVFMSYGLNALSLSLGALLPNFREPNPARIISGFGGTLCLITSFLYILIAACILAAPEVWRWKSRVIGKPPPMELTWSQDALALILVFIVTLFFGALPYAFAKKRTKNLDYLAES